MNSGVKLMTWSLSTRGSIRPGLTCAERAPDYQTQEGYA